MSDILMQQKALAARVGQTEVKEVPGAPGFSAFYATGVWTPALVGLTIAGTFVPAATTAGQYTRVGNTVFLRGRITLTSVSAAPTGNLTVQGLPIAPATVASGAAGGVQCSFWSLFGIAGTANTVYVGGWIQSAATNRIDLLYSQNNAGAAGFVTGAIAAVQAGTDLTFEGQYQV